MKVGEEDPPSLEYIEDPYIPKLDPTLTPSLDDISDYDPRYYRGDGSSGGDLDEEGNYCDWTEEQELYLRSLTLDQILGIPDDIDDGGMTDDPSELQSVETEFSPLSGDYNRNGNCRSSSNRFSNSFSLDNRKYCDNGSAGSSSINRAASNTSLTSIARQKFNERIRNFFTRRKIRDVRVTFIDLSKPYLAKISNGDNYKKFLNIGHTDNSGKLSDNSPGSVTSAQIADEFNALSVEEQEEQRAEWSQELARVEEEITTLRTVLQSKVRHASELKRKLGITVWKEITDDMNQGIRNVKESNVYQSVEEKVGNISRAVAEAPIYQKTESVLKSTAEKTTSIFGGLTSKLSQMKNSDSYKSFEEKVGSAYENVKTKVSTTTSRSSSVQNFDDIHEAREASGLISPTIPEGKPIP